MAAALPAFSPATALTWGQPGHSQGTARAPQGGAGEMLSSAEPVSGCRKQKRETQGHCNAEREAGGAAKPKAQLRARVWVFNPADINDPGLQFRETS